MSDDPPNLPLLCPSSSPEPDIGVVFGIVVGTDELPQLGYLTELLPITEALLVQTHPANPTEVFRFAAPCAEHACTHFDGTNCLLAQRAVETLSETVSALPPCRLRSTCRWWQQEGRAACLRCPQIVTESRIATEQYRKVANPSTPDISRN